MMKATRLRSRNRYLLATAVAAVAGAVAALAAPALASTGSTTSKGPGYPPPAGIYKPFVNCPLNDPRMHEAMSTGFGSNGGGFSACTAATATDGSITLGNITTPVTEAVHVQFGFMIPPGDASFYPALVIPPLAGPSAVLRTKPDVIPGTLSDALSCATATDATVQNLCRQIAAHPEDNQVTALAQEAGAISNFQLLSWTQPVKFKLINPLLGSNCYIGSNENPVMLQPQLGLNPGGSLFGEEDPFPTVHPDIQLLGINGASATATGFDVPGVLGCGPGGAADVAVDEALNSWAGLPTSGSASAGNTLQLNGQFAVVGGFTPEDSSLPQPQDAAAALLNAFQASTNGEKSVKHELTMDQAKALFSPSGG